MLLPYENKRMTQTAGGSFCRQPTRRKQITVVDEMKERQGK